MKQLLIGILFGWSVCGFAHAENYPQNAELLNTAVNNVAETCYSTAGDVEVQANFMSLHPYITSLEDAELMVFVDCSVFYYTKMYKTMDAAGQSQGENL